MPEINKMIVIHAITIICLSNEIKYPLDIHWYSSTLLG